MRRFVCKLRGHRDDIYGHDLGDVFVPSQPITRGQSKHRCTRCGYTWTTDINVHWD